MYPETQEIQIFDAVTPVAVTSSTDATPIVVTATAHGLSVGQRVMIYGHTTNVAANGIFQVIAVGSSSTFSLGDEITGANVAGSGAGAGSSGLLVVAPPVPLITGFRNAILQIGTTGTSTLTLKVAGSVGRPKASATGPRYDYPNMGATVVPSNPYYFLQIIPLDTQTALAGNTGLALSGADINNNYEVNINAIKYLTVVPTAWTQGVITAKLLLTTNA